MFCPNCGNPDSAGQKYCRTCGLSLAKSAQSIADQLPSKLDESIEQRSEKFEKLGVAALSVFGLGVLGFLLYGIVVKLMITQGLILTGLALLGTIIILGCGLLSVVLFAKANELKESVGKRKLESAAAVLPSADTGKLLEPAHHPTFSVTDRTTELLSVEKQNLS
jgi:hypothetical protein